MFESRELAAAVQATDIDQLRELALDRTRPERSHALVVEPITTVGQALDHANALAALEPTDEDAAEGEAEQAALPVHALPRQDFAKTRRFVLQSGLTVLVKRMDAPFSSVILGYRGGAAWARRPLVGQALGYTEQRRFNGTDALAWGVGINYIRTADSQAALARFTGASLPKVLELLSSATTPHIRSPFAPSREARQLIAAYEASPERVRDAAVQKSLMGSHPYALSFDPHLFERVHISEVSELVAALHRADQGVLVFVGNMDSDTALAQIDERLSSSRAAGIPSLSLPRLQLDKPRARLIVVNRPSQQVHLTLACLAPTKDLQEQAEAQIIAIAVREPVHRALRELTGTAYYVSAHVAPSLAGAATLSWSTTVHAAHLDTAFKQTAPWLQARQPIAEPVLTRVKHRALKDFMYTGSTASSSARALYQAWLEGHEPADLDRVPELIRQVSQERATKAIDGCLERSALVLTGDRSRITPVLSAYSMSYSMAEDVLKPDAFSAQHP